MKAALTIILVTAGLTGTAMSEPWRGAAGQYCDQVCTDYGRAVTTGPWKGNNRQSFYVCRANVNGEGRRPGYNLDGAYGRTKCVVPHGGKEVAVDTYDCLCNSETKQAKGGSGTADASLAAALVREGNKLLGVCVKTDLSTQRTACPTPPNPPGTGDGECTHFVQLAVKNAGARAPIFDNVLKNRNYNWGTKVAYTSVNDIQPGDIVQFWQVNFTKNPTDPTHNNWGTGDSSDPVNNPTHHTALVVSKSGTMVTVLEQNWANVRLVQQHTYDYSWKHTGDVFIYRVAKP